MSQRVLILSGPNLNLLGQREPGIYGADSIDQVVERAAIRAVELGIEVDHLQSNHEGVLIDAIQTASPKYAAAIINLGGYSHSSIAIRDALLATKLPFVEVHISNIISREEFRHRTVTADLALGVVTGFGADGYRMAVEYLARRLNG